MMATTQPEDLAGHDPITLAAFSFSGTDFRGNYGVLEEIAQKENLTIEPGALAVIARMAEGSLRDALSLLEQAQSVLRRRDPGQRSARIARGRAGRFAQ